MRISESALRVLELLTHDDTDDYSPELVHEKNVWMIGTKSVSARIAKELLFFCCISADGFDKNFERWTINGTGMDMLANPDKTSEQINLLLQRH